jgi:alpha-beta hydrolase superfamily lysophospholipase
VLKLANKDFSRDPAIVAEMDADPLIENETQPTQTVAEMVRADERLKVEFPLIKLPADHSWQRRQSHEACRQPVFLRSRRLRRQDAEDL